MRYQAALVPTLLALGAALLAALPGAPAQAGTAVAAEGPAVKPALPWNEQTVRAIAEALKEPNRDLRCRAAWALGLLQRNDAAPALVGLLGDEAPEVRLAAAGALANMGVLSAADALLAQARDEQPELRRRALEALAALGAPRLATTFAAALGDEDEQVRNAVVRSLPAKGASGAEAEAVLLQALADASPRVRRQALLALGRVYAAEGQPPASVAQVLAFLGDGEPMLRAAASQALGALADEKVLPALVARLKDEHYLPRRSAAEAIGRLRVAPGAKVAPAGDPLVERLGDPDHTVRQTSAGALGRFVPPVAIYPLAGRLEDETVEVRHAAAEALSQYAAADALKAVAAKLLESTMLEARREAAWVLVQWQDPVTADTAVAALADKDYLVRARVLRTLRLVGDVRAVPHAVKVLQWENRFVQYFDEMAEAYLVARKWPDERFVPGLMARLRLAPNWDALLGSNSGPPTSHDDMTYAVVTSGYFKRKEFNALLERAKSQESLKLQVEEALAIANDLPWTPPPPRVAPPERTLFFITVFEPGEMP